MQKIRILWADDEIEMLKPHLMFLEQKGYEVITTNNGRDAIDLAVESECDLVFLDENMPGMSGLEALSQIKEKRPLVPVIMITKSEEETIMEEAIGSKISDYLIKPVNPNQILLSIKKNLNTDRLVREQTSSSYQQAFRQIGMELNQIDSWEEWVSMYKRLVYWELQLEQTADSGMHEILRMQKTEANNLFSRFIERNYMDWMGGSEDRPVISPGVFKRYVAPHLERQGPPVFLFMIDNLRYDQWKVIEKSANDLFTTQLEACYASILPTATQFSRNAFFAGYMPLEIQRRFPDHWVNDNEEGGKNLHEEFFLKEQLKRLGIAGSVSYTKVIKHDFAKKILQQFKGLERNALNVIVYNFVDILSHAKTEVEVIRELADNDKAYRSLTQSWFLNSPLYEMMRMALDMNGIVMVTTDHGTINVDRAVQVAGDRNTTTNLRYKHGKSLQYPTKDVFVIQNPAEAGLPTSHLSSSYIFGRNSDFLAYPNNYNHYVNYFKNTYQHGGISMEEMIIPFAILKPKKS